MILLLIAFLKLESVVDEPKVVTFGQPNNNTQLGELCGAFEFEAWRIIIIIIIFFDDDSSKQTRCRLFA